MTAMATPTDVSSLAVTFADGSSKSYPQSDFIGVVFYLFRVESIDVVRPDGVVELEIANIHKLTDDERWTFYKDLEFEMGDIPRMRRICQGFEVLQH